METVLTDKISAKQFRSTYFSEDEPSHLYELMEGEILRRGSPAMMHQRVSRKLLLAMQPFVEAGQLGELFYSPLDVVLDQYNVFQPDLVFIANSQKEILTDGYINGSPELVIEIISPSSVMRDRIQKKRIYERAGVREYWLVSPEYSEIEIFVLENKKYELFSAASIIEGELKSKVLEGLVLNLKEIFE